MIQLCILFILAGFDKLDTDCGHGIADDITNHRWIDPRKASTMTWRFPSCAQCGVTEALIQIFVPLPGPRRSGYICGRSGQQLWFTAGLCNAPFMPIAFLFFFFHLCPRPLPFHFLSSPPEIQYGRKIGTSLWKKDSGPRGSVRILRGCRRRRKVSWLPEYSVLDIQPFDCASVLSTAPCSVSCISWLAALSSQLNSAAAVGRDSHHCWWESSLETYTAVCSSCVSVC